MNLFWDNQCLISIIDTDGLVLYHRGINSHNLAYMELFQEIYPSHQSLKLHRKSKWVDGTPTTEVTPVTIW